MYEKFLFSIQKLYFYYQKKFYIKNNKLLKKYVKLFIELFKF